MTRPCIQNDVYFMSRHAINGRFEFETRGQVKERCNL